MATITVIPPVPAPPAGTTSAPLVAGTPAADWQMNASKTSGHPPEAVAAHVDAASGVVKDTVYKEVPPARVFVIDLIDLDLHRDDDVVAEMANQGQIIVEGDSVAHAAQSLLTTPEGKLGFAIGTYLMAHAVSQPQFLEVRSSLESGEERRGFDAAACLQIGRATTKKDEMVHRSPMAQAGYCMMRGLVGATPDQKDGIATILAEQPMAMRGADHAIRTFDHHRQPWHKRWARMLGL